MSSNSSISRFEGTLDLILEDADIFATPSSKLSEIDEIEGRRTSLQAELRNGIEQVHSHLALEIRNLEPRLTVWLDHTGDVKVRFGPRRGVLSLRADPRSKGWMVGNTAFDKRFAKYNHKALNAGTSVLANAICDYYTANYKKMRA